MFCLFDRNVKDAQYAFLADDSGLTIKQISGDDGITHRKVAWSDFKNINTGEEFRFNDWGLEDEGTNPQTFSSEATYSYKDIAIEKVSEARSTFGAYHNRLEHSFNVNSFTAENLDASESRIRDTDMAEEIVRYTKQNILEQAVMSMLSQANQSQQGVLSLLVG